MDKMEIIFLLIFLLKNILKGLLVASSIFSHFLKVTLNYSWYYKASLISKTTHVIELDKEHV